MTCGRATPDRGRHGSWLRPYVPFVLLTLGYLGLRYALFGEVAREGMLTAAQFDDFLHDLSVHLRRMVIRRSRADCFRAHDRDTRCDRRRRDRRDRRTGRRAGARDHQAGRLLSCCLDRSGGCADTGRRIRIPASHVPGIGRVGSGARRCVGCALARTAGSADAGAGRHGPGALLAMYGLELWQDVQLWGVGRRCRGSRSPMSNAKPWRPHRERSSSWTCRSEAGTSHCRMPCARLSLAKISRGG